METETSYTLQILYFDLIQLTNFSFRISEIIPRNKSVQIQCYVPRVVPKVLTMVRKI